MKSFVSLLVALLVALSAIGCGDTTFSPVATSVEPEMEQIEVMAAPALTQLKVYWIGGGRDIPAKSVVRLNGYFDFELTIPTYCAITVVPAPLSISRVEKNGKGVYRVIVSGGSVNVSFTSSPVYSAKLEGVYFPMQGSPVDFDSYWLSGARMSVTGLVVK